MARRLRRILPWLVTQWFGYRTLQSLINPYTLLLYLVSVSCIVVSQIILSGRNFASSLPDILLSIGFGILVTNVVSSMLNIHFGRELERSFSIVRAAESAAIWRIYLSREQSQDTQRVPFHVNSLSQIRAAVDAVVGSLDVMAVSGTDFFQGNVSITDKLNKFCQAKSKVHVRVLLLDPRSKHAVDRAYREEGNNLGAFKIDDFDYFRTNLCGSTIQSLKQIDHIRKYAQQCEASELNIEVRLYDTAPALMMVRVDERMFWEQYHFGLATDDEKQRAKPQNLRWAGRKIAVVEVTPNSVTAKMLRSHFAYIWYTSCDKSVGLDIVERIEQSLRDGIWKYVYLEAENTNKRFLELVPARAKERT